MADFAEASASLPAKPEFLSTIHEKDSSEAPPAASYVARESSPAEHETSLDAQQHAERSQTHKAEESTREAQPTETQTTSTTPKPENNAHKEDLQKYLWYKCGCDPAEHGGHSHYWLQIVTNEASWDEPNEPYWIWNAVTQSADDVGLQRPSKSVSKTEESSKQSQSSVLLDDSGEVIERYNPKIHGNYDPTAPYARYHEKLRAQRDSEAEQLDPVAKGPEDHYSAMATFNRATGAFQAADQNTDKHNDYNKSVRQLSAYFDYDAAAHLHGGQSLKEERRNRKYTKEEMREMIEKRKEKKHKKRMDFYLN